MLRSHITMGALLESNIANGKDLPGAWDGFASPWVPRIGSSCYQPSLFPAFEFQNLLLPNQNINRQVEQLHCQQWRLGNQIQWRAQHSAASDHNVGFGSQEMSTLARIGASKVH